jgi:hypothetical protein
MQEALSTNSQIQLIKHRINPILERSSRDRSPSHDIMSREPRHAPLQVNSQTSSSIPKITFRPHRPFHIFKTGPVSYLPSPQTLFPTLSRLMPRIAIFQLHSMHTCPTDLQSQLHADFNFHKAGLSLRECFWNVTHSDVMRILSGFRWIVVRDGWGVSWTGVEGLTSVVRTS